MEIEIYFSTTQARQEVGTLLNMSIGRTTFYVWRQTLNLVGDGLTHGHIQALAIFGNFVRSGQTLEIAKQSTISKLRSLGL